MQITNVLIIIKIGATIMSNQNKEEYKQNMWRRNVLDSGLIFMRIIKKNRVWIYLKSRYRNNLMLVKKSKMNYKLMEINNSYKLKSKYK